MMTKYEYLNDKTAEKVTLAEVYAITNRHDVSPTLEDGLQLYGVFTFRIRHRIIEVAELLRLGV